MIETQSLVIGAGVVGLAVARELALTGREVLVLERASKIGTGTSSRSSEVIHSGIYYSPESVKARLCVAGRKRIYAYCRERGVPHRRTGKLIVATSPAEIPALHHYSELAALNGLGALRLLSATEANLVEPAVVCLGALHVLQAGIVDSHALMTALWGDLQRAGGEVVLACEVDRGQLRHDGFFELTIRDNDEPVICRELVNSAGLQAPDLAHRLDGCAIELAPKAYYARGHYFVMSGQSPFSGLVYPIAESGGLGIHVTLDLAGTARFGPDVEWVGAPDYDFDESKLQRFTDAIRRYYPGLDAGRLRPGSVGVRPKIAPADAAIPDFRIDGPAVHGVPGLVQLYGIESPGLTAALAIGEYVRTILTN